MKSSGNKTGCGSKNTIDAKEKNQSSTFQKGNQLWKRRARCGRLPKYRSAEQFMLACQEYFEWVEQNPLYSNKVVGSYKGEAIIVKTAKPHPMTILGLCLFLGISQVTWYNYKKRSPDFLYICNWVEQVVWDHKFKGAVLGYFKPCIISRGRGLRNQQM